MKIKQVCERTGLTERTVRYYIEQQLIVPEKSVQSGRNLYTFSEADVAELDAIASLRRAYFSLDEIRRMKQDAAAIPDVLETYRARLREDAQAKETILSRLDSPEGQTICDLPSLIRLLAELTPALPLPAIDLNPHFGRFDGITQQERAQEYARFQARQRSQIQHGKIIVSVIAIAEVVLQFLVLILAFSSNESGSVFSLILAGVLSVALFMGVRWVRWAWVIISAIWVLASLSVIPEMFSAEFWSYAPAYGVVFCILFLYRIVSSVLLFASKSVSEFFYVQKNG